MHTRPWHAPLSPCSHADSHISCFLNPLYLAVLVVDDLDVKKHQRKKLFFFWKQLCFFVSKTRLLLPDKKTPLDLYSHLPRWWIQNRAKTDVFAFNERGYHITTSWIKNNVCQMEWDAWVAMCRLQERARFVQPTFTASVWAGLSHYWQDSLSIQG